MFLFVISETPCTSIQGRAQLPAEDCSLDYKESVNSGTQNNKIWIKAFTTTKHWKTLNMKTITAQTEFQPWPPKNMTN